MKRQIIFNLDENIVEKLKSLENRSRFVNDILIQEFNKLDPKKMNVQELDKAIAKRKAKLDYEQKLKEIEE